MRGSTSGPLGSPRSLAAALVLLACAARVAAAPQFRLELEVESADRRKPFLYVELIDRAAKQTIEFSTRRALKDYALRAQQALAKKLGYHPKIYGKKYHQYVQVKSMRYRIVDERTRRTLLEGKVR